MKIGEFAELCNTKISVLRHYDKEGVLIPDLVDPLTGYRYYRQEQEEIFQMITILKHSGFSLKEIRKILSKRKDKSYILQCLEKRKIEIEEMLIYLKEVENITTTEEEKKKFQIVKTKMGLEMNSSLFNPEIADFSKIFQEMEKEAMRQGYQRISNFRTMRTKESNKIWINIQLLPLNNEAKELHEVICQSFKNDERIIGKWKVVGEYATKEDFFANISYDLGEFGDIHREVYFLPGGQRYWIYGWTKDFIIIDNGREQFQNAYKLDIYEGKTYMFIEYKSYYYRRGGQCTILVLCQMDQKEYRRSEITKKDNINLPFLLDEEILGKWKAVNFCRYKEDFADQRIPEKDLYFKEITFFPNGACQSVYADQIIFGMDIQTWTKNYVLRKWNQTACAYEIRKKDDVEYLIMEWKSGDYQWGGFEPDYYVFIRKTIE